MTKNLFTVVPTNKSNDYRLCPLNSQNARIYLYHLGGGGVYYCLPTLLLRVCLEVSISILTLVCFVCISIVFLLFQDKSKVDCLRLLNQIPAVGTKTTYHCCFKI